MRELAGKGWRVLGYFVWMLGVGVVLDSEARLAGGCLLLAGALAFAVGTVQSLFGSAAERAPLAAAAEPRAVAKGRPEGAEGAGS